MTVGSFAGRYSDDVPGGAGFPNQAQGGGGGESEEPFRPNAEGSPGGWVKYEDDEGNDKFYSEHVLAAPRPRSVLSPRTALLDQGSHDSLPGGGASEEGDKGLLSDGGAQHTVEYRGEDGQRHALHPYGVVTSVHKGQRVLCLKNCDAPADLAARRQRRVHPPRGDTLADAVADAPHVWPNTALPLKAQAQLDKVEAVAGSHEAGQGSASQVEQETDDIHVALAELRQRTREAADAGDEGSLASLAKQHEAAEESLELAKEVTHDAEYEQSLEASVADLKAQLNASEHALDLASKDDFSYLGKLVPGQREGELGALFQAEDPQLLRSIRRGDFAKEYDNSTQLVRYQDVLGHEISKREFEKLKDKSGKDIKKLGQQAKELFDALPLVDSHMMGDDKPRHHRNEGPPDDEGNLAAPVSVPLTRLDRLCLLCESLAGGGALSSVPACEGMTCTRGAWQDSDASTLYDERTLKVALHPPTKALRKLDVLSRARFPEADPEPNAGLGRYAVSETTPPAQPVHSIWPGAMHPSLQGFRGHAFGYKEKGLPQLHSSVSNPRRRTAILKALVGARPARARGKGGAAAAPARPGARAGAEKHERGRRRRQVFAGKPLTQGQTRAMACSYLAQTTALAHKPILERLFEAKYHTPLRCTGSARAPRRSRVSDGVVRAGGADFATPRRSGRRRDGELPLRTMILKRLRRREALTQAQMRQVLAKMTRLERSSLTAQEEEEVENGEEPESISAKIFDFLNATDADEEEPQGEGGEGEGEDGDGDGTKDGDDEEDEGGKGDEEKEAEEEQSEGADAEDEEAEEEQDEETKEEEEEEEEEEQQTEAAEESVYLYVGRDAKPAFQYKIEDILSKQELHGEPVQVKTFRSIAKEAMRAVAWAPDCGLVLFPPFYSYPDFSPEAARDLRNFVRGGSNVSGTVLFVGGGLEISVMNKLFDFNVHSEYVAGPYYKNERYVKPDSSFATLPDLIPEVGNVYGMVVSTLPPNSRSFYDSFGVSVAACVRYDLGRVCFLAQDFLDVLKDEVAPWSQLLQALLNYE